MPQKVEQRVARTAHSRRQQYRLSPSCRTARSSSSKSLFADPQLAIHFCARRTFDYAALLSATLLALVPRSFGRAYSVHRGLERCDAPIIATEILAETRLSSCYDSNVSRNYGMICSHSTQAEQCKLSELIRPPRDVAKYTPLPHFIDDLFGMARTKSESSQRAAFPFSVALRLSDLILGLLRHLRILTPLSTGGVSIRESCITGRWICYATRGDP